MASNVSKTLHSDKASCHCGGLTLVALGSSSHLEPRARDSIRWLRQAVRTSVLNTWHWISAFGTCSPRKSVTKRRADCLHFPVQPSLAWPHRISRRASNPVNPKTDLVPVCPNCHAMLHRRDPPYDVEQLRGMLRPILATPPPRPPPAVHARAKRPPPPSQT